MPNAAVIVFAREPVPGRVKTRLAASLVASRGKTRVAAHAFAAAFYRLCLDLLFQTLADLSFPVLAFVTPDGPTSNPGYFARFRADRLYTQQGSDLGQRMRDAFIQGFARYDKLLLIGSDLPQLRAHTLLAAYDALDRHDCVLGPAEDGGYYLIGFSQSTFCDCFHGVTWSAPTVLAQTLEALAGKKTALLEPYRDVDDVEDLDALARSGACPDAIQAFLREWD